MKVDIEKMKAADFIKELPQSVQQLDAFRSGSVTSLPG